MTTKLAKVIGITEKVNELIARAQQSAPTPEQLARDAQREALQRRARNLSRARPAIKPHALRAIVSDTLDDTPPLIAMKRWLSGGHCAGDGSVLFLSGGTGCGKGVAASWAIAECGGEFVSAFDLVNICTDFDRAQWYRIINANVLVVDDVGDELYPEKFGPVLKQLIDRRCSHLGKTILPTNHGTKFLKARYDDPRLWSRMHESAEFASVDGPDLRRVSAQNKKTE